MKKILALMLVAAAAIVTVSSCSKGIKCVSMDFKIDDKQGILLSNGRPYKIVEVAGKSQKELYDMVRSNIMKSYQNPSAVMSEDAPNTISVNGYEEYFMLYSEAGTKNVSASYTFTFEFKDGKIKVTPSINEVSFYDAGRGYIEISFSSFINDFIKINKPTIPSNYKSEIQKAESIINTLLNTLLWSSLNKDNRDKDNW